MIVEQSNSIINEVSRALLGKRDVVEKALMAIYAGGHILLEDVPGTGKTTLALALSRALGLDFKRVQFTPDLMPSDVLGTTVFNMKSSEFDFHMGPVFADIVLVDEINRAPAKTQAALFEVMEERQVTIDGKTHAMGDVFTIIATQNPVEQEGTYKLPEAQLDRFVMKITMGYPSVDEEVAILDSKKQGMRFAHLDEVQPVLSIDELLHMRAQVGNVRADASLLRYIAEIAQQTRQSKAVYLGASPRASVAVLATAKAYAMINGRDFVTPDDIKFVVPYVYQHRLMLTAEAEMQGFTPFKVAQMLMDKVEVPK